MASKKKCFKGECFFSFARVIYWGEQGYWFFVGDRAFDPRFVFNRSLRTNLDEYRSGRLRQCLSENGRPFRAEEPARIED